MMHKGAKQAIDSLSVSPAIKKAITGLTDAGIDIAKEAAHKAVDHLKNHGAKAIGNTIAQMAETTKISFGHIGQWFSGKETRAEATKGIKDAWHDAGEKVKGNLKEAAHAAKGDLEKVGKEAKGKAHGAVKDAGDEAVNKVNKTVKKLLEEGPKSTKTRLEEGPKSHKDQAKNKPTGGHSK
jgi:hypothetical protein